MITLQVLYWNLVGINTQLIVESVEYSWSAAAPAAGYTPTKRTTYNQGFAARRALIMSANPRGSFSFVIPFDHIFGFSKYDKVIYGVKHSLTLTRNSSDDLCIHWAQNVEDEKSIWLISLGEYIAFN